MLAWLLAARAASFPSTRQGPTGLPEISIAQQLNSRRRSLVCTGADPAHGFGRVMSRWGSAATGCPLESSFLNTSLGTGTGWLQHFSKKRLVSVIET